MNIIKLASHYSVPYCQSVTATKAELKSTITIINY